MAGLRPIRMSRGCCPGCFRSVATMSDGRVAYRHRKGAGWCKGWGEPALPLSEVARGVPDRRPRTYALTELAQEYMRLYREVAPAPVKDYGQGLCPVCGELNPLNWTGRMGLHPKPDGSGLCTSVGRKPLEAES